MTNDLMAVKQLLEEKYIQYCCSGFIDDDPVQIPHLFSGDQNKEIAGFFAAVFAWGQRRTIIAKSKELVQRMDNDPYAFIKDFESSDLKVFRGFRHRTFGEADAVSFAYVLAGIYRKHSTMDDFLRSHSVNSAIDVLRVLRRHFESSEGVSPSSLRHVANVDAGSAAKRINMFLRWMVRTDREGVDFGLWSCIKPSDLLIPLDVHVGNVSRELHLLTRKQNDLKAVLELSEVLRSFDPNDPVKYDFALFSIGINKTFA